MATIYDAFDVEYRLEYLGIPVHPEWSKNIKRWTYYSDSFNGGNDFRSGQYLVNYILESGEEYENRIKATPLDNHCKSVVETYNSFLFRTPPKRDYGTQVGNDPALDPFLADADLDGRTFDAFMRDCATYSAVYGHVWVMVDKPSTQVSTRAEELDQDIRPYVAMITPENVIDWAYERKSNGVYGLKSITLLDGVDDTTAYYRTITATETTIYTRENLQQSSSIVDVIPNPLGVVPCIPVYAGRSQQKGMGISDISDIADMQRAIYNELSEVEQLIRVSNHPSLVKTSSTQASAGAGAVIDLPDDLDPNLKPFLLEPNGSGIDHILSSIKEKVDSINRMANMGGVRSTTTRQLSGIAMQTERELLNARLSQKADNLELAEEQIWRLWAKWQGIAWDGVIDYPDSFNIHDKENTVALLKLAKETNPQNGELLKQIDIMLAKSLIKDEDVLEKVIEYQAPAEQMEHPSLAGESTAEKNEHIQEMIMQGLTDQQILDKHPELTQTMINTAKRALLDLNNGDTNNG
jgi:hypothetical protein